MLPTGWFSLVFFFVLVAPGLLFDLLRDRRRIGAKETTFREISRVILASGAFTSIGLAVLALADHLASLEWTPDVGVLLSRDADAYIAEHVRGISVTLALLCGTSMAAAAIAAMWGTRGTMGRIAPTSAWTTTFRPPTTVGRRRQAGDLPYVRVRMKTGAIYKGHVAGFTADLELEDRELVLAPPLSVKRPPRPTDSEPPRFSAVPAEWQRLVLQGKDVESIFARYEHRPPHLSLGALGNVRRRLLRRETPTGRAGDHTPPDGNSTE